jgi:hypothetical protein
MIYQEEIIRNDQILAKSPAQSWFDAFVPSTVHKQLACMFYSSSF